MSNNDIEAQSNVNSGQYDHNPQFGNTEPGLLSDALTDAQADAAPDGAAEVPVITQDQAQAPKQ